MKTKNFIILLLTGIIVVGAGFYLFRNTSSKTNSQATLPEGSVEREAQEKTQTQESQTNTEGKTVGGYTGKILAGTTAPFIIFNLPDYEQALKDNKIIILDFFANWCPECREEAPKLHAGFDALNTDKVVGFRINYNDTDTTKDGKDMAGKYGITFQHTKVILKNGKELSRDVNLWGKDTFLAEVNKALGK
ncbi:thioredoxin family protein [Candidatus Curtissbacteria bacterium]|nr:thioredoxin family protein [Candidatus Curtissbacteria bacterium]